MKFKNFLVVFLFLLGTQAFPQDLSGIPGAFANIGFGARPVGMGGAYVGLADDVNSVVWNPAGLTKIKNYETAFNYTNQLGLIGYNYLAAAIPLADSQGLGFSLITSGDKALREWTLGTSYARRIFGFSVGLNFKLRFASFGNNALNADDYKVFEQDEISEGMSNQVKGNALGFGFDLGFYYDVSKNLSVGMQLSDIYSPLFWNSKVDNKAKEAKGKYSELIPFGMEFGAAYHISNNLLFVLDYNPSLYKGTNQRVKAGMEAVFFDIVVLRGGVQNIINDISDEKYSLGFGLNLKSLFDNVKIFINYSYMFEELANSQRFGLGLEF